MELAWCGAGCEGHQAISRWVSKLSFGHDENTWPEGSSVAVVEDGKPLAGIVFHDHKPQSGTIQYSGAAVDRRWMSGGNLHQIFAYMFDDLDCQMVITGNASSNTGLHSILHRLDHTKHVIKRGWGRDMDLFLWTLTREQWARNKLFLRSRRWAEGI